jgi:hypothetical protein
MKQDVYVKLNPGFPWQRQHSTIRRLFSPVSWTLTLRKKLVKYYIVLYRAETWTCQKNI